MNTIEPPILMSRIMTFVFAAALATVVVLVLTLSNLTPLNRTQIFFLTTTPKSSMEIEIAPYQLNDANIEEYKENFVKEYIKLRNEVIPNVQVMRDRWQSGAGGNTVYALSSREVFIAFAKTYLFNLIMSDFPDNDFRCSVEFTKKVAPRGFDSGKSRYASSFRYFCTDNTGHSTAKDYTIAISLEPEKTVRFANRLENPLGLVVTEYTIEVGDDDPLNL